VRLTSSIGEAALSLLPLKYGSEREQPTKRTAGQPANGPTGGGKKDLLCAYNQQAFIVTGIEAIE
jgi:hypothetical protein